MSEKNDHTKRQLEELKVDLSLFSSGQINTLISSVSDTKPDLDTHILTIKQHLHKSNS